MITKGSSDYKKAQSLANEIQSVSSVKRTEGQWHELQFNKMGNFLQSIINLNIFASNIATTIGTKIAKVPQLVPVENARKMATRNMTA